MEINWSSSPISFSTSSSVKKPELKNLKKKNIGIKKVGERMVARRPVPFTDGEEYCQRLVEEQMALEASKEKESTTNLSKASNKKEEERIRANKRKKAEEEKKKRIEKVKANMALGNAKGRRIRSSLMGVGGQDRSKPKIKQTTIDEYGSEMTQHTEIVYSNTTTRPELSKIERQIFHRPRLSKKIVSEYRRWLICKLDLRRSLTRKNGETYNPDGSVFVHASGNGGEVEAGEEIVKESQLLPTSLGGEESLVVLEYVEERPPILGNKGMVSNIVNYWRGEVSDCPISAGGGDRPNPKKGPQSQKPIIEEDIEEDIEEGFLGPEDGEKIKKIMEVEKARKKKQQEKKEKERDKFLKENDIIPEGATKVIKREDHGPFIAELQPNRTQPALINNLYVAPLFPHTPNSSDFLLTIPKQDNNLKVSNPNTHDEFIGETQLKPPEGTRVKPNSRPINVVIQPFPKSLLAVGQTEPKQRVPFPDSKELKEFRQNFISFQIAKEMEQSHNDDAEDIEYNYIKDVTFKNTVIDKNLLTNCMKSVAVQNSDNKWTLSHDFEGVEKLGSKFTPEQVCAHESYEAAMLRLQEVGIFELHTGKEVLQNVSTAVEFFASNARAMGARVKTIKDRMEKFGLGMLNEKQKKQYESLKKACELLKTEHESAQRKVKVARFILEELTLCPWNTTNALIDVHRKGEKKALLTLTGVGDPSGRGEGYAFVKKVEKKGAKKAVADVQNKAVGEVKKDDLRKLNMDKMASILRSFGVPQDDIEGLKRWDRVHMISDLSAMVVTDGLASGEQAKYARRDTLDAGEEREIYNKRLQEIWNRQKDALSLKEIVGDVEMEEGKGEGEDSDDDSFGDNLMDQLDSAQSASKTAAGDNATSQIFASKIGDKKRAEIDKNKEDAAEFLALKKSMREDKEDAKAYEGVDREALEKDAAASGANKAVIRKKIIKTFPDGTQETTFQFIVQNKNSQTHTLEAIRRQTANAQRKQEAWRKVQLTSNAGKHDGGDQKVLGHAMFAEGRTGINVPRGAKKGKKGKRKNETNLTELNFQPQMNKFKKANKMDNAGWERYAHGSRTTGEDRRRRRTQETKPHIEMRTIFDSIIDQLRAVECSADFRRPVNAKQFPDYRRRVKRPMDLNTMLKKNNEFKYSADLFLDDARLIWENAANYNGVNSTITANADQLNKLAEEAVEVLREDLDRLESLRQTEKVLSRSGPLTDAQKKAKDQEAKEYAARKQEREAKAALQQSTLLSGLGGGGAEEGGGGGGAEAGGGGGFLNLMDIGDSDSDSSDEELGVINANEPTTPPPKGNSPTPFS
ncbi:hypothetical protein TrLO_g10063 [Triparma laevis f. longispina]|uniref:Bromo domain-containing protein n=1 Tax=Triparma laevis f. longispina TaxID=1714387 RepID=A0A9W7F4M6_9STRA|nr:hypothetical protein TrLO_g10063 [Triparma laevis f. longispina]